jgi:hypothetical protein
MNMHPISDNIRPYSLEFIMKSLGRDVTASTRIWWLKTVAGMGGLLMSLALLAYGCVQALKAGVDFRLRYNEAAHVRSGIDPYDVYVNGAAGLGTEVGVHVPWTYWFMEAFTYAPFPTAKVLYLLVTVSCFMLVLVLVGRLALKITGSRENILPAVGVALCNWQLVWLFFNLNFGLICALGMLIMIAALNAKREVPAGFGFFLVMLKPQLAILLLIPLFIHRRIKTIAVAATVCTFGLLVVSMQLSKAPWVLLLETVSAGKSYLDLDHFKLYSILHHLGLLQSNAIQILQLATGALVTFFCCLRARHCGEWFLHLLPAAVCSLFSFYGHRHDQVVLCLFVLAAVIVFHHRPGLGGFILAAYMILTVMTPSLYTMWGWGDLEISVHNLWRYGSWIAILCVLYLSKHSPLRAVLLPPSTSL